MFPFQSLARNCSPQITILTWSSLVVRDGWILISFWHIYVFSSASLISSTMRGNTGELSDPRYTILWITARDQSPYDFIFSVLMLLEVCNLCVTIIQFITIRTVISIIWCLVMATFVQQMRQTKLNITNQSQPSGRVRAQLEIILLCWLKFIPKMLVYISQMVPYFSLFDTFMDQTQDSSISAAADIHSGTLDIEQNRIFKDRNKI